MVVRFPPLALLVALAACSVAEDGPATIGEPGSTARCFSPTDANRYAVVTPGRAVDGIAFFHVADYGSGVTPLGVAGAVCGTARDRPACEAEVRRIAFEVGPDDPKPSSWSFLGSYCPRCKQRPIRDFGVVTAGDAVTRLSDADALIAAIAPLETADEALVVLRLRGGYADCADGNVRVEPDGFVFRHTAESRDACFSRMDHKVFPDGRVVPLDRTDDDDDCQRRR